MDIDALTTSKQIPPHVAILIIEEAIGCYSLDECLRLRLVNSCWNAEVLRQLFSLFRIDEKIHEPEALENYKVDELINLRYWMAWTQRKTARAFTCSSPEVSECLSQQPTWLTYSTYYIEDLHDSLNQAVDLLGTTYAISRDACFNTVCKAAVCLLGSQWGWRYIHRQQPHVSLIKDEDDRAWQLRCRLLNVWECRLSCNSMSFWAALAFTYRGDIPCLKNQLDNHRVHHENVQSWVKRTRRAYHTFFPTSAPHEREWLDILMACMTIAIRQKDIEMINFLLSQDPATSAGVFWTMPFQEHSLLELSVQTDSFDIVSIVLRNSRLKPRRRDIDSQIYGASVHAAVKLPQSSRHRNKILRLLFKMCDSWQDPANFSGLLDVATMNNDVVLAKMMFNMSSLANPYYPRGSSTSSPLLRPDYFDPFRSREQPLATAALLGHTAMVRFFLSITSYGVPLIDVFKPRSSSYHPQSDAVAALLGDPNPDLDILRTILSSSQGIELELVHFAVFDEECNIIMTTRLFEHLDPSDPVSTDENHTTTLAEQAIAAAVLCNDLNLAKHLIESLHFRITRPVVLTLTDPWIRWAQSTHLEVHHETVELREFLTHHGLVVNDTRTAVWPFDPLHPGFQVDTSYSPVPRRLPEPSSDLYGWALALPLAGG